MVKLEPEGFIIGYDDIRKLGFILDNLKFDFDNKNKKVMLGKQVKTGYCCVASYTIMNSYPVSKAVAVLSPNRTYNYPQFGVILKSSAGCIGLDIEYSL